MTEKNSFDAIIIGGSYAGLSAAMALGRSLRTVLVIDSGSPCNRQTPHSHNFLTQDGETPAAIAAKAKEQVLQYKTVSFQNGTAVSGKKTDNGFAIDVASGESYSAKKLVFATGIKDLLPPLKGFSECWGITVIHCPYCHGYEFRGQKTGILANGERAFHLASLVRNLTDTVTLITDKAELTAEQVSRLQTKNVSIIEKEVVELVHQNGHLKHLVFQDGTTESFTAVYAAVLFEQHSGIPVSLGCELTEQGHIKVDMFQKTSIAGVFACGDNTNPMRSVAAAVSAGNLTGAMVNRELTDETF
ncbi:NAD(P)/FAD-dependent oxidoreductase [Flavisolibacter sp. BT320]|nr:NAD(P)/FAD-dependent oxidoreductase [Flavisolibacter longurius]